MWRMRDEVLTVGTMKFTAFWNLTQNILTEVYRRFEGIYCLHLQRLKVSRGSKQAECGIERLVTRFIYTRLV
jgi:hypothetical protein